MMKRTVHHAVKDHETWCGRPLKRVGPTYSLVVADCIAEATCTFCRTRSGLAACEAISGRTPSFPPLMECVSPIRGRHDTWIADGVAAYHAHADMTVRVPRAHYSIPAAVFPQICGMDRLDGKGVSEPMTLPDCHVSTGIRDGMYVWTSTHPWTCADARWVNFVLFRLDALLHPLDVRGHGKMFQIARNRSVFGMLSTFTCDRKKIDRRLKPLR